MSGPRVFVVTTLVGLMMLAPTVLWAGAVSTEMIENAKTAADHNAIAYDYAAQAAELRDRAAKHKRMLAAYQKRTGPGTQSGFQDHCQGLINYYEKAAGEAEALAKLHRDMAAKATP